MCPEGCGRVCGNDVSAEGLAEGLQAKFVSYRIYIASSQAEPATCVLGHQVGWHKELLEEIKDCERSEEKKIAEAGLTCFWMGRTEV